MSVGFLETVDAGDVRVIERGENLRFPAEAGETLRILGHPIRQCFQRDRAAESGIGRPVHFAHPPRAEQTGDLVAPDSTSGG